jgi:ribosomal protein L31
MKGQHPELVATRVRCSTCGTEFTTRSTRSELSVEVCSGSRIDRFERRRARSLSAASS